MKKPVLIFLMIASVIGCKKQEQDNNSFTKYFFKVALSKSNGESENIEVYQALTHHVYKVDTGQGKTYFKEIPVFTGPSVSLDRSRGYQMCKIYNGMDSLNDQEVASLYKIDFYKFVTDTLNDSGIIINNVNGAGSFHSSRYGDQAGSTFQITRVQNSNGDEYQLDISGKFTCKLYRESGKGDTLLATGTFRTLAARKKNATW